MKRLTRGLIAAGLLAAPSVAHADPGDIVGIEIDSVDVDGDMVGDNVYGYWEYLPTAYDTIGEPWPMFIFLSRHRGERQRHPPARRMLRSRPRRRVPVSQPPPRAAVTHLEQLYGAGNLSEWDDEDRPFIVISPQNPAPLFVLGNPYDPEDMDSFLDFLIANYNVDPRRIYLTGMSMGGYSVTLHAVNYSGRYAAVSLLPGVGVNPGDPELPGLVTSAGPRCGPFTATVTACSTSIPMTSRASFATSTTAPSPHPVAQLTMYQGAGHNVWARTIDPPQGMDDAVYDGYPLPNGTTVDTVPFDVDLYDWLLTYDLPEVSAGPDFSVTTDDVSFDIPAFVTDDDAVEFTWTQTSGTPLTLTNADSQTLTVSDLAEGEYTFHVFGLDADDQWDEDDVTITILPGMGGEFRV